MVLQAAFMLDLPFILRSSGTAVGLPNDNKFFTRTRMRVHRLLETPLVFERSSANVILATFFTTHVRLSVSSHMPPSPPVYSLPSPTTSQSSDTSQYLIQHTHAGKPKDRSACPMPHTPPPTCSPNNSFSTALQHVVCPICPRRISFHRIPVLHLIVMSVPVCLAGH
jgi:hypothetical protein